VPRANSASPKKAHVMLLYHNDLERSRLLQPYLADFAGERGFVSILSGSPDKEKRKLSYGSETLALDAHPLLKSGSDPVRCFNELRDEAGKRCASGRFKKWLFIGDWTYLSYGKMDTVMRVERHIAEGLDSAAVCCYRNKGFSSLELKDIRELFEMHDSFHLPTASFVK
jgi:hypothetical protein